MHVLNQMKLKKKKKQETDERRMKNVESKRKRSNRIALKNGQKEKRKLRMNETYSQKSN